MHFVINTPQTETNNIFVTFWTNTNFVGESISCAAGTHLAMDLTTHIQSKLYSWELCKNDIITGDDERWHEEGAKVPVPCFVIFDLPNFLCHLTLIWNMLVTRRFGRTRAIIVAQKWLNMAEVLNRTPKKFQDQVRVFLRCKRYKYYQDQLKNQIYLNRFSHTKDLLCFKSETKRPFFPSCRNWPIYICEGLL